MDLIYYRGLNCRLACIINILNSLNVKYTDAFFNLWSETDFNDETKYRIYTSKRLFINFETNGIIIESLECDAMKMKESIEQIMDGELFFAGVDGYNIPWHPLFKHFHNPHYFFAQKESSHSILCFDSVYNGVNIRINIDDIISSTFELCRIHKMDTNPQNISIINEAQSVLNCHPKTIKRLSVEIMKCEDKGKDNIMLLHKQINAMINNRYLFQHFLHNEVLLLGNQESFFNETYFAKWEAVRNGLYKAFIVAENKSVINEVDNLFTNVMYEEMSMAKEIISIYN